MRRAALLSLLLLILLAVPAAGSNDPRFPQQWGVAKIRAESAWQTGTGEGVIIAVVDSGVDLEHEDLSSKLVGGADFIQPGTSPMDEHGHGTHVAGIAAAITGNGLGVAGTAPGARIMPVRVLDQNGDGFSSDVEAGIRWAVDHGAKVINLSLGGYAEVVLGSGFSDALEYAWSKGAIPVVAAGNEFLSISGYEDDPALVVSATNKNDGKPDFSNGVGFAQWGIAAPGGSDTLEPSTDDIISSYFDPARPSSHNLYAYLRGTSMAAPHVSGAAAVLLSLGLSPQQTVDRLLATAKDVGTPGRDVTFGAGRLDLQAAVSGLGGSGQAPPAPEASSKPSAKPGGTQPSRPPSGPPGTPQSPAGEVGPQTGGPPPPLVIGGGPQGTVPLDDVVLDEPIEWLPWVAFLLAVASGFAAARVRFWKEDIG